MAHPFHEHRQTKKEHSRVGHITKAYAKGGAVKSDKKIGREALSLHKAEHKALGAEGHKSKHRMDKPHRAKGGRVKGNAKTVINVITGGHPAGGAVPPMPPPGIAGAAMPPPGAPPMAARPPMPMPPPGGPPPGMPMRAKGGRVQKPTGTGVTPNSDTSKKTDGSPVFNASTRNGTQISHDLGKSDQGDVGRKKVVTFASGGRVRRFEATDKVASATRLPGGGGGGEARLAKAHREARR